MRIETNSDVQRRIVTIGLLQFRESAKTRLCRTVLFVVVDFRQSNVWWPDSNLYEIYIPMGLTKLMCELSRPTPPLGAALTASVAKAPKIGLVISCDKIDPVTSQWYLWEELTEWFWMMIHELMKLTTRLLCDIITCACAWICHFFLDCFWHIST